MPKPTQCPNPSYIQTNLTSKHTKCPHLAIAQTHLTPYLHDCQECGNEIWTSYPFMAVSVTIPSCPQGLDFQGALVTWNSSFREKSSRKTYWFNFLNSWHIIHQLKRVIILFRKLHGKDTKTKQMLIKFAFLVQFSLQWIGNSISLL